MQLLADDPIGTRVLQVNAYDVDRGSSLRYSIVPGSYSARDPFNRDVLSTAQFDYTVSMVRSWLKNSVCSSWRGTVCFTGNSTSSRHHYSLLISYKDHWTTQFGFPVTKKKLLA